MKYQSYVFFLVLILLPGIGICDGSTRITRIDFFDEGSVGEVGGFSIDTTQDDCDTDPDEVDLEPFFDTYLGLTVRNELNREIRFTRFRYRMNYTDGSSRRRVRVRRLGIASNFRAPADEDTQVIVPLLTASSGSKSFPGKSTVLPEEAGFSKIRAVLIGRTEDGRRVKLKGKATISVDNVDRCSS